jgi:putative ABC transport system permease protein
MWRNYLTVGLRSLAAHRTYAFINIFGLAIGFAACVMILLYVRYELSYDKWVPGWQDIYQLQTDYVPQPSGEDLNLQISSYVAGQALKKDFPEVDKIVYVLGGAPTVTHEGQAFDVDDSRMVDGPFFDVFKLPFVHGDPATALAQPGSLVLSETQANRFFGEGNPVGRTLALTLKGEPVDHRVTGVMKDLPKNSHMRIGMAVRFDPTSYFAQSPSFLTGWGNQGGWVYAALRPGTDIEAVRSRMPGWEERNIPESGDRSMLDQQEYKLVNIADVHLGGARDGEMSPGNDGTTIVTFAIIAALILAMACVNFTNLATARAGQRAREVALRKVLGASRRQLVAQFLGESILIAGIAMLLALATAELLLAPYSSFLDADLSLDYLGSGGLLLPVAALVLIVGAAGGLYPAFYLSRFKPAKILRANAPSVEEGGGGGRLRNVLVVCQFAVSIGLIVCTAVVYAQTSHVREIDPGYERAGLLQVDNMGATKTAEIAESLIQEIGRLEGVSGVTRSDVAIGTDYNTTSMVQAPGQAQPVEIGSYTVRWNFFDVIGVRPLAGRSFDETRPADDSTRPYPRVAEFDQALAARGMNVMLNEVAARRLGFTNPSQAVGKQVRAELMGEVYGQIPLNIIGVVPDGRFRSAREPVQPIVFRTTKRGQHWMLVRHEGVDRAALLSRVEAVWKRLASDVPFSARYSDAIIGELYEEEDARAEAFAIFSLLAVVIGCLGLFGLAAFTAERRTKEIGIRKVLGARSRDIVRLLAWQFSKPVIVANLIAWPVAWWVMRDWLNGFDTRIGLGPMPFLLAGFLALAIALGTIAGHAFKVARANPIHALRYE